MSKPNQNTCNESACCESTTEDCGCAERVLNTPCPVEATVEQNTRAFFEAMHQAKVEVIKEKIKAEWGEMLDKQGDAVVASLGAYWKSVLCQAKSQCDHREEIKNIFLGACQDAGACETK